MKKCAFKDWESFKKIDGYIICPTGDYSAIKQFPARCSFGMHCAFGKCCIFCKDCSFGEECSFEGYCSFDKWCGFGEACSFNRCCNFGERCRFSEMCSFGERCFFGKHCSCEAGKEFISLFQVGYIGSSNGTTQFWLLKDYSILVRCGCFCDKLDKFVAKVEETHQNNHYAKDYLVTAEFARFHFDNQNKKQKNAKKI